MKWRPDLIFLLMLICEVFHSVAHVSVATNKAEQQRNLANEKLACVDRIGRETNHPPEPYCPAEWHMIVCWPDTPAGSTSRVSCPGYVHGFDTHSYASRECLNTGQWFFNETTNLTYAHYVPCLGAVDRAHVGSIIEEHMGNVRLLYNVCYGISLVALTIATVIMLLLRTLHCERNTIHINLFLSFIFRAVVVFVREGTFVQHIGFPDDVIYINGKPHFDTDPNKSHWACRMLLSLTQYIILANYMWIFVEGLHLHTLIFVNTMTQKKLLPWYLLIGWGSPILFIMPWVLVRIYFDNTYCWTMHAVEAHLWIIKGPIAAFSVLNFIFFVNIIRVLFTKILATNSSNPERYKKLARATLVLIPLFGVYYIIFICIPWSGLGDMARVVKLYIEQFVNSFQGFVVALLFCFLNGEVRAEIRKRWYRRQMRRGSTTTRTHIGDTSYVSEAVRDHKIRGNFDSCRANSDQNSQNIPLCDVSEMQLSPIHEHTNGQSDGHFKLFNSTGHVSENVDQTSHLLVNSNNNASVEMIDICKR